MRIVFLLLAVITILTPLPSLAQEDDALREVMRGVLEENQRLRDELGLEKGLERIREEQKALFERSSDNRAVIAAHNQRITDLITWVSILAAIVIAIASVYINKLRKEAHETAKDVAEDWINNEATQRLETKFDSLSSRLSQKGEKVQQQLDEQLQQASSVLNQIHEHNKAAIKIKEKLENIKLDEVMSDPDFANEIEEQVKLILSKPEEQRTPDDWFSIGLQAYHSKNYKEAYTQWNKIITAAISTQEQVARAMYYSTHTMLKQNKLNDAISACEQLLNHFKDSDEPSILEWYANTLLNQGVAYEGLEQFEDALNTQNKLLKRFNYDNHPYLHLETAKALVNKGAYLLKLNRPKEAIDAYDQLLSNYNDRDALEYQELIAASLLNKSYALGLTQQLDRAISTLEELVSRFSDSDNPTLSDQVTLAMQNSAEYKLINKETEGAIQQINKLRNKLKPNRIGFAIIPFIAWLADETRAIPNILTSIDELDEGVEFTWSFTELRPYIDTLPDDRQSIATCFINFFEGDEHNRKQLDECLKAAGYEE